MRRRPFRQAIPFHEIREREERALRNRQRRRRAMLAGGAISGFAAIAIVSVSLLSAFGPAEAVARPSASPAGVARVPATSTAAALGSNGPGSEQPLGGSGAGAQPPGTPRPTEAPATPLPSVAPTPTPSGPPPPSPTPTTLEPEQLTGYAWPLRGARVSSFFEPRSDGFLVVDGQRIHEGLDLATFCGDRVVAAHDGVVLVTGRRFDTAMGFDGPLTDFFARIDRRHGLFQLPIVVVVDDGNGYRSAYVHLGVASVKPGQVVKAGDLIGYEGASGHASGCHLHYELFRMDGPSMAVAPEFVKRDLYPAHEVERIDPFRVLSMKQRGHPRFMPGVDPPAISPGLGRPSVSKHG